MIFVRDPFNKYVSPVVSALPLNATVCRASTLCEFFFLLSVSGTLQQFKGKVDVLTRAPVQRCMNTTDTD